MRYQCTGGSSHPYILKKEAYTTIINIWKTKLIVILEILFAERPNILLIVLDDFRPMLRSYGDQLIKAPNMDRLARNSVLFTRAFSQVCICKSYICSLIGFPTYICLAVCPSAFKLTSQFNFFSRTNRNHSPFLAHLSWKLKWAFLITCRPSSVRPSVCLSVNFSHFHLLLQNHWANFNQTWHKASLGKGDSSLFKWRAPPFSKGR